MSELKVEISKIDKILPIPNADRLEVVVVKGWECVVGKGIYKEGDICLYIPVDAILPNDVENILFPLDSKIKLSRSRIRTIRIRQQISQGLVVNLETLGLNSKDYKLGDDLAEKLGITKYEPPKREVKFTGQQVSKKKENPYFKQYTDIENIKWFPNMFAACEAVVVTAKCHGSNWRAGWTPNIPRTIWDKVRNFFGILPKWTFVYGSRRMQLQRKKKYNGYYDQNIYLEMVEKYDLVNKIPKGYVVYGEVYGYGVQKNYNYGCKEGERKLIIFDVQRVSTEENQYLDWDCVELFSQQLGVPHVPVVYRGPFNLDLCKKLSNEHPSKICSEQPIEEGVVVKTAKEPPPGNSRKIAKLISDAYYLDKNNSDHH